MTENKKDYALLTFLIPDLFPEKCATGIATNLFLFSLHFTDLPRLALMLLTNFATLFLDDPPEARNVSTNLGYFVGAPLPRMPVVFWY